LDLTSIRHGAADGSPRFASQVEAMRFDGCTERKVVAVTDLSRTVWQRQAAAA